MKHIVKEFAPSSFEAWKQSNVDVTYKDLTGDVRYTVRSSLKKEQHGICCYCECHLNEDFHIEHFRPKGLAEFSSLQLDYENLHACCMKIPSGGVEEHCGHKKGNVWDDRLVSPMEADCEEHFLYTLDGAIHGVDERGVVSINILNLNSELLKANRVALIHYFEDLPDYEKEREISFHLNKNAMVFGEYFTMVDSLKNYL